MSHDALGAWLNTRECGRAAAADRHRRETPKLFKGGDWRLFFTGQHGDNVTWEVLPNPAGPALLDE